MTLKPLLFICFLSLGHAQSNLTGDPEHEREVNATLWFQTSGEMRALSYQAFNLAKLRLDQDLTKSSRKKRAVVVDVDETILDNSPYQARAILTGEGHYSDLARWVEQAEAPALPGALEFIQYAVKKGVSVFYITNRREDKREATIKNLKAQGFPVREEWVMMRQKKSSSKESRRKEVLKSHRIVLLMGDNLGDFARIFEKKPLANRNSAVDQNRQEFGKRFIMIPNPMYGDWEKALYNYRYLREEEKAQKRREAFRPFYY